MWESRLPSGEISKGLVERVGSAFGFPRFPQPRHFHSSLPPFVAPPFRHHSLVPWLSACCLFLACSTR